MVAARQEPRPPTLRVGHRVVWINKIRRTDHARWFVRLSLCLGASSAAGGWESLPEERDDRLDDVLVLHGERATETAAHEVGHDSEAEAGRLRQVEGLRQRLAIVQDGQADDIVVFFQ